MGIISTPVCHSESIISHCDKFIVIGSDGIWDAMANDCAIGFVNKFAN